MTARRHLESTVVAFPEDDKAIPPMAQPCRAWKVPYVRLLLGVLVLVVAAQMRLGCENILMRGGALVGLGIHTMPRYQLVIGKFRLPLPLQLTQVFNSDRCQER